MTSDLQKPQQHEPILIYVAVAGLLILLAAQAILSMRQKSVTVDEIMYITAGYYHLKTGDFQMNMTNPPLAKVISALPLIIADPELPPLETDPADWDLIKQWQYARAFFYENRIDADTMLFLSRLSIVLLSIGLGLFIFIWGRELYGSLAALFALFLYSFSPNILAHTRLATQDLALTAFIFLSVYCFWKYINCIKGHYLVLAGAFFGLAVITKMTALSLILIFGAYGLIIIFKHENVFNGVRLPITGSISDESTRSRRIATLVVTLLIVGLIGMLVINLGYGFQGFLEGIDEEIQEKAFQRFPAAANRYQRPLSMLMSVPIPLPSPYVRSLLFQFGQGGGAQVAFFAGRIYEGGLWYLTLVSFVIKTPLPILILSAASMAYLFIQRKNIDAEWLMILSISFFLVFFSYFDRSVGRLRYVLPIFPFIFLLISRLLTARFKRPALSRVILLSLSLWYLIASLSIYPHYLAYFNEIIGGPRNGYKMLADSNVDWGQDLKALKFYMEENEIDSIKLAYFGSADANYYDIEYDYLPSVGLAPKEVGQRWWYEKDRSGETKLEPQQGTIAVSANILASPDWLNPLFYDDYWWLREREPVDQIGYSILIYEIE